MTTGENKRIISSLLPVVNLSVIRISGQAQGQKKKSPCVAI